MPLRSTTYTADGGPVQRASVAQPEGTRNNRTIRDRIKRLHLDAIDPKLARAFDEAARMERLKRCGF